VADRHMQIGEVAERTSLSLRTIRYYEEVDLVLPSARSQGGFRLYTESDVDRLLVVKRMKPLDFSLDETRDLLQVLDALRLPDLRAADRKELLGRLAMYREIADSRIQALRAQLETAEGFAADLRTHEARHVTRSGPHR
jgi:MerR family copper efflux transcriptional regulator